MTGSRRWPRLLLGRPARVITAVALGAALLGGATGGALGGLGAAASDADHSEHVHAPRVPGAVDGDH